jgi:hypothetical protein
MIRAFNAARVEVPAMKKFYVAVPRAYGKLGAEEFAR